MKVEEGAQIKAQEWMVRFDGKINRSEMSIEAETHDIKIKNLRKE